MKFCSNCGKDIIVTIPEGDDRERFVCKHCAMVHYTNPRMIVGCLALWEEKILLCRRAISPRKNLWNLPAGFMENGETLEEGAIRETFEESQGIANITKLYTTFSLPDFNQVYFIFLAELKSNKIRITPESSEVHLFDKTEIPWNDIAFASTSFTLEKYLKHGPNTGTVFHGQLRKDF